MVAVSCYSSLASLSAAVAAPLLQMLIWDIGPELPAIVLMSLLLIWRHSANIRKLMAGTESKLGQKAAPPAPVPSNHGHGHGHAHKPQPAKHSHKAKHSK